MSFHEIKKDAKIVDEILLYLLKNLIIKMTIRS